MIARVWQGVTSSRMADQYLEYLDRCVIPAYQEAAGNAGLFVMKESRGELVHFLLLSFWTSEDSLANFVGADLDVMKPTAEEKSLLIAFESIARNYKVVCEHTHQRDHDEEHDHRTSRPDFGRMPRTDDPASDPASPREGRRGIDRQCIQA